jgi:hypothetical protein
MRRAVIVALMSGPGCAGSESDGDGGSSGSSESGHACPDDAPPRIELVDAVSWTQDAAADPYPAHRPPGTTDCATGFWEEYGTFEVDTTLCGYASFTQPALADVPACSRLELSIIHDALFAEAPATAHIAVGVAGAVIWEAEVAIPGPYALLYDDAIVPPEISAGTPIELHLHNHGYNQWRFVALAAVREP